MSASDTPRGPLRGMRVLDCTRVLSGPICGRMLVDLGAEVVKIEAPEGDMVRAAQPRLGDLSTMFAQFNVGKRNVGIDLKAEGGPELLARLAERADVFLENFRPGVLAAYGLGSEALLARNPSLVYASITGWGQEGPWAGRPAYAPIVHAEAGTLAMGARLRGAPVPGDVQQHGDVYAGLMAANAILAALFERERDPERRGQHLDIAMGEVLLYVCEHAAAELAEHPGPSSFDTWNFRSFELGNGRSVHLLGRPTMVFGAMVSALGRPEVLDDPRFASAEAIEANGEAAIAVLAECMAQIPDQAALEERLTGLPMVVAGIRSMNELAASPWAAARELTIEAAPGLRVPRAPWHSNRASIGAAGGVAPRGENNRSVAGEWLGLDAAACEALETSGVFVAASDAPATLEEKPRAAFRER